MMEAKDCNGNVVFSEVVEEQKVSELMQAAMNNPDIKELKVTRIDKSFKMDGNNRNSPCICGSGKKFKKCCGNPAIGNEERREQKKKPIFINSEMPSEHKCMDSCCNHTDKK